MASTSHRRFEVHGLAMLERVIEGDRSITTVSRALATELRLARAVEARGTEDRTSRQNRPAETCIAPAVVSTFVETRPLGKTGHESSVLAFGPFALQFLSQPEADEMVETVLDAGVNHFDVVPTYGDAETELAPTLADRHADVFLGCKTQKRTYDDLQQFMREQSRTHVE